MKKGNAFFLWLHGLLFNSRFWILATAITASVTIAGYLQLVVPGGSLQTIRIEQTFGFISLALLYCAIVISPLTKVFPNLPGKDSIVHARRAIGVSAFYFAALHMYISFFGQLGGFAGVPYLTPTYHVSLLGGVFALGVLGIMAATSFDWVIDKMGYKHWKLLHRLVYLASLAVLGHVLLIGTHFANGLTPLGVLTYGAAILLITLEVLRVRNNIRNKGKQRG
jgi:sulfoxide reductase heme-binding subunit YedZ